MDTEQFMNELLGDSRFLGSASDSSIGLSASHLRKLKKAKLKIIMMMACSISNDEMLQEAGKMLLLSNRCASHFYDLLILFEVHARKLRVHLEQGTCELAVIELSNAMNEFCTNYPELEYNEFIRDWHRSCLDNSGCLCSLVSVLHVLMIEWYGRGLQASGFSRSRVSVSSNLNASILEILLVLVAVNKNRLIPAFDVLTQKDLNAAVSAFKIFNGQDVLAELTNAVKIVGCEQFIQSIFTNSIYGAFVNVFLKEDSPNRGFQCSFVQREDFVQGDATADFVCYLINALGYDCLKHRRLFVREKGVVIKFIVFSMALIRFFKRNP